MISRHLKKKINKSIAYHYILIWVVFRGKNSGKKNYFFIYINNVRVSNNLLSYNLGFICLGCTFGVVYAFGSPLYNSTWKVNYFIRQQCRLKCWCTNNWIENIDLNFENQKIIIIIIILNNGLFIISFFTLKSINSDKNIAKLIILR